MADDFYTSAAAQRFNELEASRARAVASLHEAKAANDQYSASAAVQELANIDAEARNLSSLHQQYQRSQNPPPPQPISRDERLAKPLESMDWDDALEIARTSKVGADLTHDDCRAGYAEVQRRRARGE